MSNCLIWFLKLIQLLVVAAIATLFSIPQQFDVNEDAVTLRSHETALNMTLPQLLCQLGTPEGKLDKNVLKMLTDVFELRNASELSETMNLIALCLLHVRAKNQNEDISDCYCINSFWIASTILVAITWVLATIYDMIMICLASRSAGALAPTPAYCSCIFAVFSIFVWSGLGGMTLWYIFFKYSNNFYIKIFKSVLKTHIYEIH